MKSNWSLGCSPGEPSVIPSVKYHLFVCVCLCVFCGCGLLTPGPMLSTCHHSPQMTPDLHPLIIRLFCNVSASHSLGCSVLFLVIPHVVSLFLLLTLIFCAYRINLCQLKSFDHPTLTCSYQPHSAFSILLLPRHCFPQPHYPIILFEWTHPFQSATVSVYSFRPRKSFSMLKGPL